MRVPNAAGSGCEKESGGSPVPDLFFQNLQLVAVVPNSSVIARGLFSHRSASADGHEASQRFQPVFDSPFQPFEFLTLLAEGMVVRCGLFSECLPPTEFAFRYSTAFRVILEVLLLGIGLLAHGLPLVLRGCGKIIEASKCPDFDLLPSSDGKKANVTESVGGEFLSGSLFEVIEGVASPVLSVPVDAEKNKIREVLVLIEEGLDDRPIESRAGAAQLSLRKSD